jgi:hypothetical protein
VIDVEKVRARMLAAIDRARAFLERELGGDP